MKKKVILIDLIALIGMLLSFMPDLTGLAVHEWLGLAVGGVVLVHLLQHWQWVLTVSQGLLHKNSKVISRYLIDAVLGLDLLVMVGTGLMISSLLMLPLANYNTWRLIHVVSSYGFLAVLGLKIAIHWDWVVKAFSRMFETKAGNMVKDQERRKFFRTCLIGGAAFVVAFSEYKEWQRKTAVLDSVNNSSDDSSAATTSQNENTQANTATNTAANVDEATPTVTETAAAEPISVTSTPAQPTAAAMPEAAVETVAITGVVRCNKACSYPGRCRKYQDTITQNGKCDLGEAIW